MTATTTTDDAVRHWAPLARAVAHNMTKHLTGRARDQDAVQSDALLGLFKALRDYRTGRGKLSLRNYILLRVKAHVVDGLRERSNSRRKGRLAGMEGRTFNLSALPEGDTNDTDARASEALRRWRAECHAEEMREEVEDRLAGLPEEDAGFLAEHYLNGVSQVEWARRRGKSDSWASLRMKRIRERANA